MSIGDNDPVYCREHPHTPAAGNCAECTVPCCERCLLLLRQRRVCGACKHALLSRHFAVRPSSLPGDVGAGAPLGSDCAAHAGEPAFAVCERCGDFMCGLCTTPYDGRFYCASCFDLQWSRHELHGRQERRGSSAAPSFALATLGLGCAPFAGFGLVPALAALIWSGAILLRPDQSDRGFALASLVLASIGLICSLAVLFSAWSRP